MPLTNLVLNDGSVLALQGLEQGKKGTLEVTLEGGEQRSLALEDLDVEATLLANAPEPITSRPQGDLLELKALSHELAGDYLTVEGLVGNISGEELRDLAVKVMAYDRAEDFVTSGEALLDFNPLAKDAESPFKAIVKSAGRITRVRVQFYHLMGEVLPHRGADSTLEV